MKNIEFLSENFPFLAVKFSIYLNRPVFVMFFASFVVVFCIFCLVNGLIIHWMFEALLSGEKHHSFVI